MLGQESDGAGEAPPLALDVVAVLVAVPACDAVDDGALEDDDADADADADAALLDSVELQVVLSEQSPQSDGASLSV
jgi:hypothetical protein